MNGDEKVRWLRPQSEERKRRHRAGWLLVLGLGAFVCLSPFFTFVYPVREGQAGSPAAEAVTGPEPPGAAEDRYDTAGLAAEEGSTPDVVREPMLQVDPLPAGPEERSETTETGAIVPSVPNDPQAPAAGSEGWWVVLGSVPEAAAGTRAAERVTEAARRCEAGFASGRSSDYEGLTPGLLVFLFGPHTDRAAAQQALRRLTPCIGDAYVKWAKQRASANASAAR